MLTSKQRAQLRGFANGIDTIMQIGKDGVTESVIRQAQESIGVRELIKVRVLETAMLTPREACEQICAAIGAEPVQCIGTRFVMYKRNAEKPTIELIK